MKHLDDIRRIIEKAERQNNAKIFRAKRMSLEQEIINAFKAIEQVKKAERRFRRRF